MGKRRIRCLNSIGNFEIVGLDPRLDRRIEALLDEFYGPISAADCGSTDL